MLQPLGIHPLGIVLPFVQPGKAGTLLEGVNTLRQKVTQDHHRRQALPCQKLDPIEHVIILTLQIRNFLPKIAPTVHGIWHAQSPSLPSIGPICRG
jgi:hypothetical protein